MKRQKAANGLKHSNLSVPLLYGAGKELEAKKVAELKEKAAEYHDFNKYVENEISSFNNLRELIEAQISCEEKEDYKPVLLYQVPMTGQIGVWKIKGIADLIAIWPNQKRKS